MTRRAMLAALLMSTTLDAFNDPKGAAIVLDLSGVEEFTFVVAGQTVTLHAREVLAGLRTKGAL